MTEARVSRETALHVTTLRETEPEGHSTLDGPDLYEWSSVRCERCPTRGSREDFVTEDFAFQGTTRAEAVLSTDGAQGVPGPDKLI